MPKSLTVEEVRSDYQSATKIATKITTKIATKIAATKMTGTTTATTTITTTAMIEKSCTFLQKKKGAAPTEGLTANTMPLFDRLSELYIELDRAYEAKRESTATTAATAKTSSFANTNLGLYLS
ncbi:hypothetical protein PDE_09094 [Penicillium oxalicum 114-2]|uniref:Uncharacterized protein n=1 Tax=Penicillium oxalicum (strain 114-2 / CGMCC 5302) TaxID=933388 RepID=S8BG86_PENO1|nr:hypothetical protein PDE_09094 [Penicillium oxalicum 114-2]